MSLLIIDFDGNVLEEVNTEIAPKVPVVTKEIKYELDLQLQIVENTDKLK